MMLTRIPLVQIISHAGNLYGLDKNGRVWVAKFHEGYVAGQPPHHTWDLIETQPHEKIERPAPHSKLT